MGRAVGLAISVALLVGFVAFAYTMNPGDVDFRITSTLTHRMPLGLLLVATLVTGVLIAVVAVAGQHLNHRISTWSERRKARQVAEVEELNASGAALAWGGETERSRSVLKKAWRRDPNNKQAALALAASYVDTGEYEAAQNALQAAVEEQSADPDLRFALGEALRRNGETEDAIRMHETVRVQYPHSPRVLVALRELYAQTGRWEKASEIQERYISELAGSEGIHRERDRLRDFRYHAALQLEDAGAKVSALEAIASEYRDFTPVTDSIGDALYQAGREDDAMKLWEKSFKREPRIELAARMLEHQSDLNGRQRVVSMVNKHASGLDDDQVRVLRASAALANDDLDAAQEELESVSNSASPAVQRCWADLYHRRGDSERAWQTLRPLES